MLNDSAWTSIRPQTGWRVVDLREVWAYRELLLTLTLKDIRVRYKQTVIGAAWAVFQPLLTMIIFTIIFGRLAKIPSGEYPYPIFVFAALLPWMFFANAITSSANSLVISSQLVNKIYFPRIIIPMSSIGVSFVDFMFSTAVLLVLMVIFDVSWTFQLLMMPLVMFGVILCALGVGTLLSALTVSYRDLRFVIPFAVQIWMFLSPVVYGTSFIPEDYRWIILINPMTGYIEGFRSAILGGAIDWFALGVSFSISVALLMAGSMYFRSVERKFADVI
ncbi:MAG: ABC transporter permease [Gammaproteobacteria bacterium]|nr:ABC transporter permease [Gammaproteobacteria bacterium]NIM71849.1 ABC transporter permease [Gammaproteobacteria bacterium]NIN37971.1 ABC transporter permease [Gammaproteobacteria bacterium]NIO23605.1 ABC transporter permease [Gammaproteobacteria bacterium]NIO64221.1 ABC transporter permease [Gammaproteobacteria bacterium]